MPVVHDVPKKKCARLTATLSPASHQWSHAPITCSLLHCNTFPLLWRLASSQRIGDNNAAARNKSTEKVIHKRSKSGVTKEGYTTAETEKEKDKRHRPEVKLAAPKKLTQTSMRSYISSNTTITAAIKAAAQEEEIVQRRENLRQAQVKLSIAQAKLKAVSPPPSRFLTQQSDTDNSSTTSNSNSPSAKTFTANVTSGNA